MLVSKFAHLRMNILGCVTVMFLVGFSTSYTNKQSSTLSTSACDSGQECVPFTECSQLFKSKPKIDAVQICAVQRQISYICCGRNVTKPSLESVVALSWSETSLQSQKDGMPISQQKCLEYARMVYEGEDSKTEKCTTKIEKIKAGRAAHAEFPHMVSIAYHNITHNLMEHKCGGSLISERFVLTASVCVYKTELLINLRLKWVVLGTTKLDDSNKQVIPVAQLIHHPDYESWNPDKAPAQFDIALIKLKWAPILGPELRPACLPHDDESFSGRELILSGWGRSTLSGPLVSNQLLKGVLYEIPHAKCEVLLGNQIHRKVRVHNASILCAGHPSQRSAFSRADVGGPLQIISSKPFCTYTIVGIPFFAPPPDFTGTPSLYTRVQYYRRWIENIVWS